MLCIYIYIYIYIYICPNGTAREELARSTRGTEGNTRGLGKAPETHDENRVCVYTYIYIYVYIIYIYIYIERER